eukprot:6178949-Pleurochrysis_carterae.AAC.2
MAGPGVVIGLRCTAVSGAISGGSCSAKLALAVRERRGATHDTRCIWPPLRVGSIRSRRNSKQIHAWSGTREINKLPIGPNCNSLCLSIQSDDEKALSCPSSKMKCKESVSIDLNIKSCHITTSCRREYLQIIHRRCMGAKL